jgi:hypothetical protein
MSDIRPFSVTMLGVVHRDNEGIPLLERWLDRCKPNVVTLEFSRFGLRFRQSKGEELKSRVKEVAAEMEADGQSIDRQNLGDILAYIDPSFEFTVASDYAACRRIPLHLIDMDRFSRINLAHMEELLSRDNLRKTLSGPTFEGRLREKALARLFFEKGITVVPYSSDMAVRDRHMSNRIKGLILKYKDGHFVHICGWQHLRDPYGLYEYLFPRKVFIYEEGTKK